MKTFVPQSKMSKRAKKALHAEKRAVWTIDPRTRTAESKKTYSRKKQSWKYEPFDFRDCFLIGMLKSSKDRPFVCTQPCSVI